MIKLSFSLIPVILLAARVAAQDLPVAPKPPAPLEQPPQQPGLEIFSDGQQIIMLKSNLVYYTNNVIVIYPPAKPGDVTNVLRCRELTATRSPAGKVDQIVAVGDVQFDNGATNHARGQRAVYTGTNDQIVLTGPFGDSPLPMLYSTQGTNVGERIIYDRIRDVILITNQVRTSITAEALSRPRTPATNAVRTPDPSPAPKQDAPPTNSPPAAAPPADASDALRRALSDDGRNASPPVATNSPPAAPVRRVRPPKGGI